MTPDVTTILPIPTQISVLETWDEIEPFRQFWTVQQPHRDADIDFFCFFIEQSNEASRPHVIVLTRGGQTQALLVGRIDQTQPVVKFGYLRMPTPRMRLLTFVHGGLLGSLLDGDAEILVRHVVGWLAAGKADAAMFHCVPIDSPIYRAAASLPSFLWADHVTHPQAHRIRDLSNMTGAFLASLPSRERTYQRQRQRMLFNDFGKKMRIDHFHNIADVDRLMADAEAVARASYQRRLGVGFSATPDTRRWLEFEAKRGGLRGYLLYLDDKPSAFWIGTLSNNVFLSEYLAFNPVHGRYSPGSYLLIKAMEEMCEDPRGADVARIDFGIGDAIYKARLGNQSWLESSVYIYAPTIKGLWVNALRTSASLTTRMARAILEQVKVLSQVKRLWRAHAAAARTPAGD
jgi:Acetyltransferase (GNAT) domain